jgi:predicted metal-dependent enzyme (double-stranded beta helix superfamily)
VSATEEFVNHCLHAVTEDRAASAVKEIVERAVRDANLVGELSDQPGLRRLYHSDALTVAHVVIPKRRADAPSPVAHDHRMWAVIGMMRGSEDNEFFRRSAQTVVASGGRVLVEGDVVALGKETIHAVKNPSSDWPSSALHVYGGDLKGAERSMWCDPERIEERYDFTRVTGA